MRKLDRLDKLQKNVQNILVGAEHATNIFSPRGTIRRTDDIIDPQDPSQESYSWQDMAELTHASQVEKFNWCECEQQEQFPYDDCPRVDSSGRKYEINSDGTRSYGYRTYLTGAYVCYTCGHLCDCGDDE